MSKGGGGVEGVVGYGEYLVDFSKVKVAGLTLRFLVALISLFLILGTIVLYLVLVEGFGFEGLGIAAGCFFSALIYCWMLSWRRGFGELKGARFDLKYVVKVKNGKYFLDLKLSSISTGNVSKVKVFISTAYSYALVKPKFRGVRILCNGGVVGFEKVFEDIVYEGYSRSVSIELKTLEPTSHINLKLFKFVSGSFIVFEAETVRGVKGYAAAPLVFTPILNVSESSTSIGDIALKVTVGSRVATVNAWLTGVEGYSTAEVGISYLINATFKEGVHYRREVKIPLVKVKQLSKSISVNLDFKHLAKKFIGKVVAKPKKPLKPLVEAALPVASYAYFASKENLHLPPTYKSYVCEGLSVKVFYYLKLKGMFKKSREIVVEAPLPPIVAKVSDIFQ